MIAGDLNTSAASLPGKFKTENNVCAICICITFIYLIVRNELEIQFSQFYPTFKWEGGGTEDKNLTTLEAG